MHTPDSDRMPDFNRKLAIGTVQFGLPYGISNTTGQVRASEVREILHLAAERGVDLLDTAIAYGDSERCLGNAGVTFFKVVTKLPAIPDDCSDVGDWVRLQVGDSMKRLGTNELYGLLLHRPEQLLGKNGGSLYAAVRELQDRQLIRKFGISIYSTDMLKPIIGKYRLDVVQAPFNLVDRTLFTTGWLQSLKERNVEIHVRSIFLQGLLLMPPSVLRRKFGPWSDLWDKWEGWLAEHDLTALEACLAFPRMYPEIDRIIVGLESRHHLEQILHAASINPPSGLPDIHSENEKLINPSCWLKT